MKTDGLMILDYQTSKWRYICGAGYGSWIQCKWRRLPHPPLFFVQMTKRRNTMEQKSSRQILYYPSKQQVGESHIG